MTKLSIVVPVYNEEKNIKIFLDRLISTLIKITDDYEIIFALDPSNDKSEQIILDEININKKIKLIVFSRRFGQPISTIAGIENSSGDYCVVIDCDLQDPPELIEDMFNKITKDKLDVVFAVRKSRKGETLIKKIISFLGYKVINSMSDISIPTNAGDFRIFSKRVVDELKKLKKKRLFLEVWFLMLVLVKEKFFDRKERSYGLSKYNKFTGSLKIGINGIVGFSSRPLFLMTITGFIIALLSFLIGAWYFFQKIIGVMLTPGLSTMVILISFILGYNC